MRARSASVDSKRASTSGISAAKTAASGAAASLTVSGGTALAGLGWTAGTTVNGHDTSVGVAISGAYTGPANGHFTFVPQGDGVIGSTPGLEVDVYSASGQLVATLDVGDSYQPGTELEVDAGIRVSFGYGTLSATHNDSFRVELISDSDTSDVLAAVGLVVVSRVTPLEAA